MFELLFLLLPIAAAYGYYMGRNSYKDKRASKQTEQTNTYLRGVDFLLNNDDKEKAMDNFIAYLNEVHPTFESSLALGNLFRQRGEVDRAISLHTALANNEDLEANENEMAQIELARDFMSAGLLDRAEAILLDIVEIPRQRKTAVSLLVKLYEQERDLERAIEIGLANRDVLSQSSVTRICNYYCEQAQSALITGKTKEAGELLQSALELCPDSIRPRIQLAEMLLREMKAPSESVSGAGNVENSSDSCATIIPISSVTYHAGDKEDSAGTVETKPKSDAALMKLTTRICTLVQEIASCDPNTGLFCLSLLRRCFAGRKNDPEYRRSLENLVRKTSSAAVMVELCELIARTVSRTDAESMLLGFIREKPNIKLYSSYMGMRSRQSAESQESATIMQLKSMIDAQIASHNNYSCTHCGFESSMMFWQCPSCRRWDTMRPKRSIDGD